MRYRIERRYRRGCWVWALLDGDRYVGCAQTYLSAFKILQELNKELTAEDVARMQEETRGESIRVKHLRDVLTARKFR